MAPVPILGSGPGSAEDCCRSLLCFEDSLMVTILLVIVLKIDVGVTSLSVTTPLVKGGGEGMGIRGAPLMRNGGMSEALFMVVTSCDRLNKVLAEAVVFPKV